MSWLSGISVGGSYSDHGDIPFAMHWDGRKWTVLRTPLAWDGRLRAVGRNCAGEVRDRNTEPGLRCVSLTGTLIAVSRPVERGESVVAAVLVVAPLLVVAYFLALGFGGLLHRGVRGVFLLDLAAPNTGNLTRLPLGSGSVGQVTQGGGAESKCHE